MKRTFRIHSRKASPLAAATALRFRREALGLDRSDMATGLGMSLSAIAEIESGQAPSSTTEHYLNWLDRIERWPAEVREFQFAAAQAGERFQDV